MAILLRRKGMVTGKVVAEGLGIQCVRNDKIIIATDTVIRWGCSTQVEAERHINTSQAVSQVSDKKGFRKILQEQSLCPRTWFRWEEVDHEMPVPVVVRPSVHSKGREFYLCHSYEEMVEALQGMGSNYYISEFIDKDAEFRVFVAQGKVVWVARKTPANPAAPVWNVDGGGRFDNVRWKEWPPQVCKFAIEACELAELHFGAVDIMTYHGAAYVLEINTAPALTTPYRTESTIKVLKYMLEVSSDPFLPVSPDRRGYGRYIHPALEN